MASWTRALQRGQRQCGIIARTSLLSTRASMTEHSYLASTHAVHPKRAWSWLIQRARECLEREGDLLKDGPPTMAPAINLRPNPTSLFMATSTCDGLSGM